MSNGKRYMLIWDRLVDKIRYSLLRIALPKQQFYLQAGGFHSVFHPIMKPMLSGSEQIDGELMNGESNENDNS